MIQKPLPFQKSSLWLFLGFMLISSWAWAQVKITGTVLEEGSNTGIPGATVQVKGTTRGAATDVDGKFSLDAKSGEVLVISSIGYVSKQITLGNQTNLTILLASDSQSLDEVVVTGYGAQAKRDITGGCGYRGYEKSLGRTGR